MFGKQILKVFYKKSTFDLFLSKLKHHLINIYPNHKFDFTIVQDSEIEKNPDTRKFLIVEDIIKQYEAIRLDSSKFPQGMPQDLHWSSYAFNSEPNRDKLPKDWMIRKNALLIRDNKQCFRCTKSLTLDTMNIHMIRPLKSGGKYFLENLLSVCKDCEKVLTHDGKKAIYLDIKDKLKQLIKETSK